MESNPGGRSVLKFLLLHNYYQQAGGEDQVFADETQLLEARGHEVVRYTVHNDRIQGMGKLQIAQRTIWNQEIYRELRSLIRRERPVLMHCANTFPLVSPAAYYAAHAEGAAVVQTLHNYRLLCPNALFLRDGNVCEACQGKLFPWPAIKYRCYRNNRMASATVASMLATHRLAGTWKKKVDHYIALTDFARQKFIEGGFPAERLTVKSNFISPDTGPGRGEGNYAVFVGRLSTEKGVDSLLAAWNQTELPWPLKIIGDGPLAEQVRGAAAVNPQIEWLGKRNFAQVQEIIGEATCLISPSVCYEAALPRTILEAFCQGTPVVASRVGAVSALVAEGTTGITFEPGNGAALASAVSRFLDHPDRFPSMRDAARREYESRYTEDRNYELLMGVYASALRTRGNEAAAQLCEMECPTKERTLGSPVLA